MKSSHVLRPSHIFSFKKRELDFRFLETFPFDRCALHGFTLAPRKEIKSMQTKEMLSAKIQIPNRFEDLALNCIVVPSGKFRFRQI